MDCIFGGLTQIVCCGCSNDTGPNDDSSHDGRHFDARLMQEGVKTASKTEVLWGILIFYLLGMEGVYKQKIFPIFNSRIPRGIAECTMTYWQTCVTRNKTRRDKYIISKKWRRPSSSLALRKVRMTKIAASTS